MPHRFGRSLLVLAVATAVAGCTNVPADGGEEPEDTGPDPAVLAFYEALGAGREVRFETDLGTIRMVLYEPFLPRTTARFAELVEVGFHDGTIIHRVVDDFVIQGGDPSGTGMLGSGETVPFESHPDLHFGAGAVGLARDVDADSGDSQWFITEKPQPHLHDASVSSTGAVFGTYAMYGQVFEGMEVVRRIAAVATIPGADRPVEDVMLDDAEVGERPMLDLLQWPRQVVAGVSSAPVADVERPLHLFAGQPARYAVFVEPADGSSPPAEVALSFAGPAGAANATLAPLPDDPWVFVGNVTLPDPGEYAARLGLDRGWPIETVTVLPWSPAYASLRSA